MFAALKLDAKGRCPNCLKKPIPYRVPQPHFFCCSCSRQYGEAGEQQANWAWKLAAESKDGEVLFSPTYPNSDYVNATPTPAARRRVAFEQRGVRP